ncbi:unnamed protein product [Ectocarpus fasciculatus]
MAAPDGTPIDCCPCHATAKLAFKTHDHWLHGRLRRVSLHYRCRCAPISQQKRRYPTPQRLPVNTLEPKLRGREMAPSGSWHRGACIHHRRALSPLCISLRIAPVGEIAQGCLEKSIRSDLIEFPHRRRRDGTGWRDFIGVRKTRGKLSKYNDRTG